MEKIRFFKSQNIYEGTTDYINKHVIVIKFNGLIPNDIELRNGFEIINENNGYVQANYNDFVTVYRTYDDDPTRIEFSDDSSVYIEPKPIPDSESHIPTPEELEEMFQQNKNYKIVLSKSMLADFLENNPIHSTAHESIEGIYSVTNEKQTLMMSQYMTYQIEKAVNPNAKLTWNEKGKACEEWTEEEFLQLILEIKAYVYPLVSYQQRIEEEISKCATQEELDTIVIDYYFVITKE